MKWPGLYGKLNEFNNIVVIFESQENDDEAKIHIGNCVTFEQPAKKYAQPVSESPKYAADTRNNHENILNFNHFLIFLFFLEFPSNCHRSIQLWQICKNSSPVTIAAMVAFIQISVFTYQNQTNRHHSVQSMFGVKAIRHIRKPTMAQNQRKILLTMRNC